MATGCLYGLTDFVHAVIAASRCVRTCLQPFLLCHRQPTGGGSIFLELDIPHVLDGAAEMGLPAAYVSKL